jgi:hypothetical protein
MNTDTGEIRHLVSPEERLRRVEIAITAAEAVTLARTNAAERLAELERLRGLEPDALRARPMTGKRARKLAARARRRAR